MNSFPYRFEPQNIRFETTPTPDARIYPTGRGRTTRPREVKETPKTKSALHKVVTPSKSADLTAFFASVPVGTLPPVPSPKIVTQTHSSIAVVPPKEMPKPAPKKEPIVQAIKFALPEQPSSVRQFVTAFLQK